MSSNVVFLGLTSLITDISSEMVSSILPLYFVFYLQLNPLSFGAIDGLYHGVTALVRLGAGVVADRWRRPKYVAAGGYAVSAVAKLGLLAAGTIWGAVVAVIVLDRAGKGVRTAPRDALISLSSPPGHLGRAFGVHRALDTVGALTGPLVAFGILAIASGAFDAIFIVSFLVAIIGLSVLLLFVENRSDPAATENLAKADRPGFRAAVGLLSRPDFRFLAVAGGLLSLVTISDGFLYLLLQRRMDLALGFFPLLYVATAVVYLLLAIPAGRLADRVGRARVFVGGYSLLPVIYGLLLMPTDATVVAVAALVCFGAFYAATDGVLMAMTSAVVPSSLRSSGLAALTTITSLGRLAASILFGGLWLVVGPETAIACLLVGVAATIAVVAPRLVMRSS